jgi:hypothetical protein
MNSSRYYRESAREYFLNNPISLPFTLLAALPALACATSVPPLLARRRALPVERRNRAVAICRYACAPLAVAALAILSLAGIIALRIEVHPDPATCVTAVLLIATLIVGIQAFIAVRKRLLRVLFKPIAVTIVLCLIVATIYLSPTQRGQEIGQTAVNRFTYVLTTLALLSLLWWWLLSVLLVRIMSDATVARTIVIALALPPIWTLLLAIFIATFQALQFMVAMLAAWP